MLEARSQKEYPSDTGSSLIDQTVMDIGLSLTRPDWNFNMAESKGHLKIYHLNSGPKDGLIIPFIYGHLSLSLPSVGVRLTLQHGSPDRLPA